MHLVYVCIPIYMRVVSLFYRRLSRFTFEEITHKYSYVCISICICECIYVCMCICMYVYMYSACMHVCVYTYTLRGISLLPIGSFLLLLTKSYMCIHICLYINVYIQYICHAYRYGVAKMRKMPYLSRVFSAKEPYNQWLFCGKRPAS